MTGAARDRGAILVNALAILAALAFVAAGLLALATGGRNRLTATAEAHQAELYLDAAQTLLPALLAADRQAGATDHPGELWATPDYTVPIGRGSVGVRITDLQGRMNVNILSAPAEAERAEFARLFAGLGLPQRLLDAIVAFLSPSGPKATVAYLSRDLPVLPRGGPVRRIEELADVEGMTAERLALLAPYIAALPADVYAINVNTAPDTVMAAMLGRAGIGPDGVRAVLADRERGPYASVIDFRARADALLGDGALQLLALERTSIDSSHFEARIEARLDGFSAVRLAQYRRAESEDGETRLVFSRLVTPRAPAAEQ